MSTRAIERVVIAGLAQATFTSICLGWACSLFGTCTVRTSSLELCVYLVEISVVGQGKAAHEGAVAAFDSVILLFLLFLFKLPFARDGQHAVFDCNFYVFFSHLGQLSLDEIFLVIFGNVRQGRSFWQRDFLWNLAPFLHPASLARVVSPSF